MQNGDRNLNGLYAAAGQIVAGTISAFINAGVAKKIASQQGSIEKYQADIQKQLGMEQLNQQGQIAQEQLGTQAALAKYAQDQNTALAAAALPTQLSNKKEITLVAIVTGLTIAGIVTAIIILKKKK